MSRKPSQPPTLGALLADVIRERKLTSWCIAAGLRPNTVAALLDGRRTAVRRATVTALAEALGLPEAAVRAAIGASRDAAAQ